MATWQLQEAKAKFSELVDTVVILSIKQWSLLSAASRPTLKELLLQSHPRFDLDELLPPRGSQKHRDPPEFD